MISRQKVFIVIMAALSLMSLVILASGISTLNLNNEALYLLPASEQATQEAISTRVVQIPTEYLTLLTLIFLVIFPISIIYLLISPSARRRFLTQFLQISMIVLFVYFLSKNIGKLFPNLRISLSGSLRDNLAASGFDVRFLEPFKPKNPVWLTVLLSVALAIGFLVLLLWLWIKLRQVEIVHSSPAKKLARSAQTALRRIDAGQNLREVVLRCYHEMTQVVAEKRHLTRPEHMTPHEFVYSLEGVGLPAEQVRRLTDLFETVRYGHKTPGAPERVEAVACLNAIVERLGGEP
jgi:hypothetical protein